MPVRRRAARRGGARTRARRHAASQALARKAARNLQQATHVQAAQQHAARNARRRERSARNVAKTWWWQSAHHTFGLVLRLPSCGRACLSLRACAARARQRADGRGLVASRPRWRARMKASGLLALGWAAPAAASDSAGAPGAAGSWWDDAGESPALQARPAGRCPWPREVATVALALTRACVARRTAFTTACPARTV